MNRIFIHLCTIVLLVVFIGCSAHDQYDWIPWYEFRGHCIVHSTVAVDSVPDNAAVFVNGVSKGTTPYSLDHETSLYIAGQKRDIPLPHDGGEQTETRNTRFLEETVMEIVVVKQGYEVLKRTILAEELFPSEKLRHGKTYEKDINLTFFLKKRGWFSFGSGTVESDLD